MLKTLRLKNKLTQAQLGKRARVSQAYIASLELGMKRNPSLAVLRRLANVLCTTNGALVEALIGQSRRKVGHD